MIMIIALSIMFISQVIKENMRRVSEEEQRIKDAFWGKQV